MKILANYHTTTSCSYHRVVNPVRYLKFEDGDSLKLISELDPYVDEDFDCDILLFNRAPTMSINYVLKMRDKYKFKLIVDMDDHWILHFTHPAYHEWRRTKAADTLVRNIALADAVTVTNGRLAIACGIINDNVHVLPNALPFGYEQFNSFRVAGPLTRFIYAGGSSHLYDLKEISGLFKQLGQDSYFREFGSVIMAGYNHTFGRGTVDSQWLKMEDVIKLCKEYLILKELPLLEYMNCYNYADVSLAPLQETTFNACKSNLKTIEAGCKKIPIIASNVEPYTQDRECHGLVLCNTVAEFHKAMRDLMRNKHMREDLGEQLYNYVLLKYDLSKINEERRQIFEHLIHNR